MPKDISHPTTGGTASSVEELMATFSMGHLVARGMVKNVSQFRKFGSAAAIAASTVVIDGLENKSAPWQPMVAQPVNVFSGVAADGPGNLGAQTIQIAGLDSDWNEQSEIITMQGATPVESANSYIRLHAAVVASVGSYRGTNVGTISIEESESPAESILTISPLQGVANSSHYCVPAGKLFIMHALNIIAEAGKPMRVVANVAPGANVVTVPFAARGSQLKFESADGSIPATILPPIPFPAYTEIWATGFLASQTGSCFFGYSGELITL